MGKIVKTPGADPTCDVFIECHKVATGEGNSEAVVELEKEYHEDTLWVQLEAKRGSSLTTGWDVETKDSDDMVSEIKVYAGSDDEDLSVLVIGMP